MSIRGELWRARNTAEFRFASAVNSNDPAAPAARLASIVVRLRIVNTVTGCCHSFARAACHLQIRDELMPEQVLRHCLLHMRENLPAKRPHSWSSRK